MIRRVITYKCISPPPDISQWAILFPKSLVVSKSAKSVPIHYSDLQLCHTKIPNQDTISLPMRKCTKDAGSISQLNMIVFCWGISKESLSMVLFTLHNNVCTVSFTHFHFLEFITWWSSELHNVKFSVILNMNMSTKIGHNCQNFFAGSYWIF